MQHVASNRKARANEKQTTSKNTIFFSLVDLGQGRGDGAAGGLARQARAALARHAPCALHLLDLGLGLGLVLGLVLSLVLAFGTASRGGRGRALGFGRGRLGRDRGGVLHLSGRRGRWGLLFLNTLKALVGLASLLGARL